MMAKVAETGAPRLVGTHFFLGRLGKATARTLLSKEQYATIPLFSYKIPNLSHQTEILHAWSIKSKRNKKLIA